MRWEVHQAASATSERQGRFKSGHKKQGGRKRGTPNAISGDYRKAITEAAYRIGNDGNGKDGVIGYLRWVASRCPKSFCGLLIELLALESAESNTPQEPRLTREEINQSVRDYIGLDGKDQTKTQSVRVEFQSPWAWTGQDFPVGPLMHLAVERPEKFCKLIAATLPRAPARPASEEQRERARAGDNGGPVFS